MQPASHSDDHIAHIERRLSELQIMLEHQTIAIAKLRDELDHAKRDDSWYHAQFSEMSRIMARDMRELRAALICSVISDGPISAQVLHAILRQTPEDKRELEYSSQSQYPEQLANGTYSTS